MMMTLLKLFLNYRCLPLNTLLSCEAFKWGKQQSVKMFTIAVCA
jgi:hypothetical protein